MSEGIPNICGREALDALPCPALVLDSEFRPVLLNTEAALLFLAEPGELPETIGDLLGLEDPSWLQSELRRSLETGDRVCIPYFYPAGRSWFNLNAHPDSLGRLVLSVCDANAVHTLEQELDSVERRICDSFRNAALCVAVGDENGRFLEANEAFLKLTGYTLEELRARDFVSITHPDDRLKHLHAGVSMTQDGQHAAVYEKRYVRKDGGTVWVRANVSVLARPGGHTRRHLALCEDVTAARVAVEQLRLSESRFRALIEGSLDLISVFRPDGTIVYESPAIQAMLGYTPEELLGQNAFDFIHPDDVGAVTGEIAAKLPIDGITARLVFRFLHKDGTWRYLEGTGRSLMNEPAVRGIVANCRDITEAVEMKRKLRKAVVQAREATELKSRFLANMSHEIRTPMNGVIGLAELLRDTRLTAEQREYVEGIQFSADVLLRVINDILDFSKIEAGKLEVDSVRFNLPETITGVAQIFATLCRTAALDFRCNVAPQIPTMVLGDSLRLRQVMTNLLSNAVKFTPSGSVELTAWTSATGDNKSMLHVSVRDTGIGIPPEHQRRLFASFTQGDSSTTRTFGGAGLGLAICKQLLELMGGSIRLESTPGTGTNVSFDLPLEVLRSVHVQQGLLATTECVPAINRC
jgi:PAS domain S-box-containing protein